MPSARRVVSVNKLQWPVTPFAPVTETSADHIARGPGWGAAVDIACPYYTPWVAVADSRVTLNQWGDQGGWFLWLEWEDGDGVAYRATYCHGHSQSPLPVGTKVIAGAKVGAVGSTGQADGPHLHFILQRFGDNKAWDRLDPEEYLKLPDSAGEPEPAAPADPDAKAKAESVLAMLWSAGQVLQGKKGTGATTLQALGEALEDSVPVLAELGGWDVPKPSGGAKA